MKSSDRFLIPIPNRYCDVTPLAASSQGHWPDQGREGSGWSSQIGERLHPLLYNYLITVLQQCSFSGYRVVLRVRRNGWLFYFVLRGKPELCCEEEQQKKERVACPRKCRRRPRVKVAHPQRTRRPRQSEIESYAVPKGRSTKEDPAARPSGRKVPRSKKDFEEDAVSAWPAGRILPLKKFSLPNKIYGPHKSLHIPGLDQGSKDRGRSKHTVLRGCAKNRRKTRETWASADGGHCSASNHLERTTPSVLGDPDQRTPCKPPFRPLHSAVSSG